MDNKPNENSKGAIPKVKAPEGVGNVAPKAITDGSKDSKFIWHVNETLGYHHLGNQADQYDPMYQDDYEKFSDRKPAQSYYEWNQRYVPNQQQVPNIYYRRDHPYYNHYGSMKIQGSYKAPKAYPMDQYRANRYNSPAQTYRNDYRNQYNHSDYRRMNYQHGGYRYRQNFYEKRNDYMLPRVQARSDSGLLSPRSRAKNMHRYSSAEYLDQDDLKEKSEEVATISELNGPPALPNASGESVWTKTINNLSRSLTKTLTIQDEIVKDDSVAAAPSAIGQEIEKSPVINERMIESLMSKKDDESFKEFQDAQTLISLCWPSIVENFSRKDLTKTEEKIREVNANLNGDSYMEIFDPGYKLPLGGPCLNRVRTESGQIITCVPRRFRCVIEKRSVALGFSLQRQIDVLARGVIDVVFKMLRQTLDKVVFYPPYMRPTLLIVSCIKANDRLENLAVNVGRIGLSHGLNVGLFSVYHSRNTEELLYKLAGGTHIYRTKDLIQPDCLVLITNSCRLPLNLVRRLRLWRMPILLVDPPPMGMRELTIHSSLFAGFATKMYTDQSLGTMYICNMGHPKGRGFDAPNNDSYDLPPRHEYVFKVFKED